MKARIVIAIGLLALMTRAGAAAPEPWPSLLGPRDRFTPDVSAAVERIWSEPTLHRTVNGRAARVPLSVYVAFLDTPDVTAAAARFKKLGSFDIQVVDEDHYLASDGDARASAQVLRREPRRLIMLSRGEHTGRFLGTISGSALTVLDLDLQQQAVNPKLSAYVYIDSPVAAALARALVPTFGFIADCKLGEGLRVTAEVAEWAVDPSGGFCQWLAREPLPQARRDRILTALPSCGAPATAQRKPRELQSP